MYALPTKTAAAALLLLATGHVSALGKLIVKNQCSFPVYLESVSDVAGNLQTLEPNGGQYSETYRVNPDMGGISVKMSDNEDLTDPTQFEYTLGSSLWYDVSNIDGYPFKGNGLTVISSGPESNSCTSFVCPRGVSCQGAYNTPDENYATRDCPSDSDMTIMLCVAGTDTTPVASATQIAKVTSTAPVIVAAPSTSIAVASSTMAPAVSHTSSSDDFEITQIAQPAAQNDSPSVVVYTTFVTKAYTVMAGPQGPYFEIASRGLEARAVEKHDHKKAHHGGRAPHHRHGGRA